MSQISQSNIIGAGDSTSGLKPEFIRLPKNGQCPYTGLTRSKMNQLILPCEDNGFKPPVRSVCLRPKGGFKGTRLIDYQSLLNYLYSRIEEVKG